MSSLSVSVSHAHTLVFFPLITNPQEGTLARTHPSLYDSRCEFETCYTYIQSPIETWFIITRFRYTGRETSKLYSESSIELTHLCLPAAHTEATHTHSSWPQSPTHQCHTLLWWAKTLHLLPTSVRSDICETTHLWGTHNPKSVVPSSCPTPALSLQIQTHRHSQHTGLGSRTLTSLELQGSARSLTDCTHLAITASATVKTNLPWLVSCLYRHPSW